MPICSECDQEATRNHITIQGDHREFSLCWECAIAKTTTPDVLFSVPELVEIFDTPLN